MKFFVIRNKLKQTFVSTEPSMGETIVVADSYAPLLFYYAEEAQEFIDEHKILDNSVSWTTISPDVLEIVEAELSIK